MFAIFNTVAREYYTGRMLDADAEHFEFTADASKAKQFCARADADAWRRKTLSVHACLSRNTRIKDLRKLDDTTAGIEALQMPDPVREKLLGIAHRVLDCECLSEKFRADARAALMAAGEDV